MNWLGRKGIQLLATLTEAEKEKCKMFEGLFHTLSNELKLRYKRIKSLQFHKLARKSHENAEWVSRLRMSATECNYNKIDRQLKEQFMHGLNHGVMNIEIIRALTKIYNNENITSEQVVVWKKKESRQNRHSQPS